jgi:hypothetical protein
MDEIVKKKDQLWIATFRDVIAYHRERNFGKLYIVEEKRRSTRLLLTVSLKDPAAYRVPLTILMKKPAGEQITSITQAGKELSYQIVDENIQFDAMPGAAEILITKKR